MIETGIAARIDSTGAKTGAREFNRATDSMVTNTRSSAMRMRGSFDRVRSSIFSVRSAIIALGAAGTLRYIVQTASSFEQLRVQLATVEGSADGAAKAFDRVLDFAVNTPFQVENITRAWIRLRNIGLEPTAERLTSIADVAAANGRDITDYTAAVVSAMVGEREALKSFGIVAKTEGDKVRFTFRGITTEVGNSAREIFDYLDTLGRTQFAGGAKAQMDTLAGATSNLADATSALADDVGRQGLTRALAELTREISDSIGKSDGLAKALGEDLAGAVGLVTDAVKGGKENWETIKSVLLALAGITSLGVVARGLRDVAGALKLLGATSVARFAMANPAVALALLAGGGLYAARNVTLGGKGVGPPMGGDGAFAGGFGPMMGAGGRDEAVLAFLRGDLAGDFARRPGQPAPGTGLRGDDIKAGAAEAEEAAEAARKALEDELELRRELYIATIDQNLALIEMGESTERVGSLGERAFEAYAAGVANIETTSARAFRGVEDALVSMATGGKASFADLVNSALRDLVRLQIQMALMGIGKMIFGGLGGSNYGAGPGLGSPAVAAGAIGAGGITGPYPDIPIGMGAARSAAPQIHIVTPPGSQVSEVRESRENGAPRTDILIESVTSAQVATARNGGGLARLPGVGGSSRSRTHLQG